MDIARSIILAVDLDALLSSAAPVPSTPGPSTASPAHAGWPEPSFSFVVGPPNTPLSSSSSPSPLALPSDGQLQPGAPAATESQQPCLAWLRPGVRRFLLAVNPHVHTVLLVRRRCVCGRDCCGAASSGGGGGSSSSGAGGGARSSGLASSGGTSSGGGAAWGRDVGGCLHALITAALPSIDPDGQFFGQRIAVVSDRHRNSSARSRVTSAAGKHPAGAAATTAAPAAGSSTPVLRTDTARTRSLRDLASMLVLHAESDTSSVVVVSTADRHLFGALEEHVVEVQPYRIEYGKYDDVLDSLASVVTGSLLQTPSVPETLRSLGFAHSKLQPSPMMQALHAQIALRAALRRQGQEPGASQLGSHKHMQMAGAEAKKEKGVGGTGEQRQQLGRAPVMPLQEHQQNQQQGDVQGRGRTSTSGSGAAAASAKALLSRGPAAAASLHAAPGSQGAGKKKQSKGSRKQSDDSPDSVQRRWSWSSGSTGGVDPGAVTTGAGTGAAAGSGAPGAGAAGPAARARNRRTSSSSSSPSVLPPIPELPLLEVTEPHGRRSSPIPARGRGSAVVVPDPPSPLSRTLAQPVLQSPCSSAAPHASAHGGASAAVVATMATGVSAQGSPAAGTAGTAGRRRTAWDATGPAEEGGMYGSLVAPGAGSAATAMVQQLSGQPADDNDTAAEGVFGGTTGGGGRRIAGLIAAISGGGGRSKDKVELARSPKSFPAAVKPPLIRHISGYAPRSRDDDGKGGMFGRVSASEVRDRTSPTALSAAASAVAIATARLFSRLMGNHRHRRCRPSDCTGDIMRTAPAAALASVGVDAIAVSGSASDGEVDGDGDVTIRRRSEPWVSDKGGAASAAGSRPCLVVPYDDATIAMTPTAARPVTPAHAFFAASGQPSVESRELPSTPERTAADAWRARTASGPLIASDELLAASSPLSLPLSDPAPAARPRAGSDLAPGPMTTASATVVSPSNPSASPGDLRAKGGEAGSLVVRGPGPTSLRPYARVSAPQLLFPVLLSEHPGPPVSLVGDAVNGGGPAVPLRLGSSQRGRAESDGGIP